MDNYCFKLFLIKLLMIAYKCSLAKEEIRHQNPLPYFRRETDLTTEDPNIKTPASEDLQSNLVSVLVHNVKEIFGDVIDANELYPPFTATVTSEIVTSSATIDKSGDEKSKLIDDGMPFKNVSLVKTLVNPSLDEAVLSVKKSEMAENRIHNVILAKKMKSSEKSGQMEIINTIATEKPGNLGLLTTMTSESNDPRRSCIFCNNLASEDCYDPKNKLISSIACEREGDLCYSQHTPFGIVDRGCFNVNHNLTTYVCACNLCNYISISEMPYIFTSKQDWVDNVVELSHTRNLRKSVYKDMACLRCEVNMTIADVDNLNNADCLEGNIAFLPTQTCEDDEVCAVKAIRHSGYIWRGCVRTPLYNYWWALCDSDICNYDTLLSLYDFV